MMEVTLKAADRKKIQIISIGITAARALVSSRIWRLLSAYDRSFYCIDDDENIICFALNGIGRGPFTLLCSGNERLPAGMLKAMKYFSVVDDMLVAEGGNLIIDLNDALTWRESLLDLKENHHELIENDLSWLAHRASLAAPQESLCWLIPTFLTGYRCDPLEKHKKISTLLNERVSKVTKKIEKSFAVNGRACELEQLIGLGYGLTPSGDDFLAGVVMGFHKMQKHQEAMLLAHHFYNKAHGKTTTISFAFYRALADGRVAEPYMRFLEVIGREDKTKRENLFDRVTNFGGTSGWDTLAGIVFGINLVQRSLKRSIEHLSEAVC
ncbi:MAG: DUF2877 domain-containing protein [Desulfofustis sp.]|nr:DUF2877 domain-containing protein [Desulfofustis sp.]